MHYIVSISLTCTTYGVERKSEVLSRGEGKCEEGRGKEERNKMENSKKGEG